MRDRRRTPTTAAVDAERARLGTTGGREDSHAVRVDEPRHRRGSTDSSAGHARRQSKCHERRPGRKRRRLVSERPSATSSVRRVLCSHADRQRLFASTRSRGIVGRARRCRPGECERRGARRGSRDTYDRRRSRPSRARCRRAPVARTRSGAHAAATTICSISPSESTDRRRSSTPGRPARPTAWHSTCCVVLDTPRRRRQSRHADVSVITRQVERQPRPRRPPPPSCPVCSTVEAAAVEQHDVAARRRPALRI